MILSTSLQADLHGDFMNCTSDEEHLTIRIDLLRMTLVAAALSGASAFVYYHTPSMPTEQHSERYPFILHDVTPGDAGIQEATRQQWEELKPLIQRVYIEENKPFPCVASILRNEYDFRPTKRQFSRQIAKWGFRKNVSRLERRMILQNLSASINEPVPDLQDRRLKASKLQNWKRRYREELRESLVGLAQVSDSHLTYHNSSRGDIGANAGLPSSEAETQHASCCGTITKYSNTEDSVSASEDSEVFAGHLSSVESSEDSWPFDWSTVDVPGSPGLSRLFKGLEIESAHISPLVLESMDCDDNTCLSNSKIQDLFNGAQSSECEDPPRVLSSIAQGRSMPSEDTQKIQNPQYPWRNIEDVFFGDILSPFREVYVFPPSHSATRSPRTASKSGPSFWANLQAQEEELETKFTKLRGQFSEDNPAVVAIMENIAYVRYELEKFTRAESMYRKLVDVYQRTLGTNNVKTLRACERVIQSLMEQGKCFKAKELNGILRSAVAKLVQPHDKIALDVAANESWLAEALGSAQESESIRREILQIRLASHGPRNPHTVWALSILGRAMSKSRNPGGETLLRTALQLSVEDPYEDDEDNCGVMINLSYALALNGSHEESFNVATKASEQYSPLLGARHRRVLSLEELRAWSLFNRGKLSESEEVFRGLVSSYSVVGAEKSAKEFANVFCGLANTLAEMGSIEEATTWFEKSLQMRISSFGASHFASIATCYGLANCYEAQGRFEDMLKIYREMISRILELGEDPSEIIVNLEAEVIRIETLLMHWHNFCYGSKDINHARYIDSKNQHTHNRRAESGQKGETGEEMEKLINQILGDDNRG